ncbi:SDR family oxidoreductase [Crocinitomix catalasitica]|uniref:SDR family oxidoreductase n=1 Tax=Crocinitomix catalasitica TaxID=184607 RepID=UPI0004899323|nr:NAD(P)H-binding protein [Crocinitomix catalasitica]
MKTLIIGATGMVAQETIIELANAGHQLRLFSRSIEASNYPNHEVLKGDVMNDKELSAAVKDCEAIHITITGVDEAVVVKRVIEFAKTNNVKLISFVSGASVCEKNSWFSPIKGKYDAEQILKNSGIPYMIFRPTWFMETLSMFVRDGRADIMGKQPNNLHWISSKDFGKMLATAYNIPEALNQEFYAYGPEAFQMRQALEKYIKVKHPKIKKVSAAPFGILNVIAFLTRNKELKEVIPMFQYFEKAGEEGDSKFTDKLLGKPTTKLSNWIIS